MSLTALDPRRYGLPLHVRPTLPRFLPLALALGLACSKGAERPVAPLDQVHYPAWLALQDNQLLAVSLDQDLLYLGGSMVSLDVAPGGTGQILAGVPLPYMAGKLEVVNESLQAACPALGTEPYALVAGHSLELLARIPLPLQGSTQVAHQNLTVSDAANPFDVAVTCSGGASPVPRVWVSYQRGKDEEGYVAQLDLRDGGFPAPLVKVWVGKGTPRNFAWDPEHDRLYFTTKEKSLAAPVRWIGIGEGCKTFDGGVQDERNGGCHVDNGFDISTAIRGAEPNAIALASGTAPCTAGEATATCRRMYLSVRMYDVDLAKALDQRPAGDIGGKFVVLEVAEGGLGGPEAHIIHDPDIGKTAGEVLVVPRAGRGDLVVVAALDDDLLWIYDDDVGGMVKVFGRLASGVPELGHMPSGLVSQDLGSGTMRVYVSSYEDHWVSAVDIPLDTPDQAYVVRTGPDPADTAFPYLRLGVAP
jgi:hypothetical protein